MNGDLKRAKNQADCEGSLLVLSLLSLIVGAISGTVGAIFRLSLEQADRSRNLLIAWAHEGRTMGLLFVLVACASAAALAAWLVRRYAPQASGSGIPHVEAVLHGQLPPAAFRLIPVKFVGGLLAIGSGLALGREGPSVQMGASLAHLVGRIFGRTWPDCRVLMAAGAGAGLATAFNAPIAGAIFVLEELVQQFEYRIATAALGASATAIAVARVFLGDTPDFHLSGLISANAETRPLYYLLAAVAALLAVAYNRALLATLAVADRLSQMPVELRAGLVGTTVGGLAWFTPDVVGGGDAITEATLAGGVTLSIIPAVFVVRFALGTVSYAAGTPGGLFAPLLVLGAQLGLLFGEACRWLLPELGVQPVGFAVVGMAAFFTGVVRAPVTGIVLVTEMTASVSMLLPMICACFVAMLVPSLLRDPPIYDSLRKRVLAEKR
jgi:chloride channel protein, CIC family